MLENCSLSSWYPKDSLIELYCKVTNISVYASLAITAHFQLVPGHVFKKDTGYFIYFENAEVTHWISIIYTLKFICWLSIADLQSWADVKFYVYIFMCVWESESSRSSKNLYP